MFFDEPDGRRIDSAGRYMVDHSEVPDYLVDRHPDLQLPLNHPPDRYRTTRQSMRFCSTMTRTAARMSCLPTSGSSEVLTQRRSPTHAKSQVYWPCLSGATDSQRWRRARKLSYGTCAIKLPSVCRFPSPVQTGCSQSARDMSSFDRMRKSCCWICSNVNRFPRLRPTQSMPFGPRIIRASPY